MVTLRRNTKVLSIRCPACKLWVKPRRYDPRLNICWDCALLGGERTPVALISRHLPRLVVRKEA